MGHLRFPETLSWLRDYLPGTLEVRLLGLRDAIPCSEQRPQRGSALRGSAKAYAGKPWASWCLASLKDWTLVTNAHTEGT